MSGSGKREAEGSSRVVCPSYSRVSETLRRASCGSFQCSVFCGGRGCKYESPGRWGHVDRALSCLYSHWVTENIVAMARPSTQLLKASKLIQHFKNAGINTVVNLQVPGEHANCGPGLESSGFTYEPEDLMKSNVYFYNYGWMDYGVPCVESLLDVIKVVDFALSEGSVAIHCHAGLGRTGTLIACYLVFSRRMGWREAIAVVRTKRPGSVQTRTQIEAVRRFESFLHPLWTLCPLPSSPCSLEELLRNQQSLLHGEEQRSLRHIPKVVSCVCSRLTALGRPLCDLQTELFLPSGGVSHALAVAQCRVEAIQTQMNTSMEWSLLEQEQDPVVLLKVLLQFFQSLKEPLLTPRDVAVIQRDPTLDTLTAAKSVTLQCVMDAIGGAVLSWENLPVPTSYCLSSL